MNHGGELKTEAAPPEESFRDHLGIVSREGKRAWIYPKKPSGRFYKTRSTLSIVLLAILFGVPLLRVDGHSVILFDITERTFIVFGMIFGPHDFFLLALATITTIVCIFLFTALFGRLFCGWVCPQTVLMEMVFRKIDYWIEGGPRDQKRLNQSPWTVEKFRKKGMKHSIYFVLSFLIANMLLAWIIGTDKLLTIVADPPSQHLAGLTALLIFSAGFHWLFAWFREQACILVCPYGRLQGVMLDRHSIVIAYDFKRGEPRGKVTRHEPRSLGDCIDCHQCVAVCPTGIDIRNGTQLECVNCTACIDACDLIMDAIGKPRGLVRYDSLNGIERDVRTLLNHRSVGYSLVLLLLVGALTYFMATRSSLDITILRTPGLFFQDQPDEQVSNLYDVKATNKSFETSPLSFRLKNLDGRILILGDSLLLAPQQTAQARLFVLVPRATLSAMSTPFEIEVLTGTKTAATIPTTFLGPVPEKSK